MSFTINLDPLSADPYFTVREHLLIYKSKKFPHKDLQSIESQLRNLLNIDSKYSFYILPLSSKKDLVERYGELHAIDNPFNGASEISALKTKQIADISFSFPQCSILDLSDFSIIFCDSNMSFGVPNEFLLIFSDQNLSPLSPYTEKMLVDHHSKELYLLSSVLADYQEKDIEVLLRESNYKSAVLNQLVESHDRLTSGVSKQRRSKSVLVVECDREFSLKLEKLGYSFYSTSINEKVSIAIANYPTHSKELIEMFADRVAEL